MIIIKTGWTALIDLLNHVLMGKNRFQCMNIGCQKKIEVSTANQSYNGEGKSDAK